MTDQIPNTPVEPARRSLMQRVSIVWVVPLVALAIALGIAWQSYSDRGALIEIRFASASGIIAEQTQLRFREVSVGVVEHVAFAEDLTSVVAHVRLDKDVEPYVDQESVFWVVQPEVSARGVSGLQTVLSGVYIEGVWDENPGGLVHSFVGLEQAPVARPDQQGSRITLYSTSGKGLSEGVPILFKGIEVGQLGKPVLSDDGITISAEAFVNAPHDKLLSTRSRFWDASGISFNLGVGGASVDVESLATLITGGVSFETAVSGGAAISDGERFAVYENSDDARESLFDPSGVGGQTLELSMVFDENVTGLNVGAPVMLNGLPIGEVIGISGLVDQEQFGDERVRLVVVLSVELSKLDAAPDSSDVETQSEAILDFFEQAVKDGWRARLAQAGLLSGKLRIEMLQVEDAPPAEFVRDAEPYPIFPSVPADIPDMASTAEGMIQRVNDLPIEDLLSSAQAFLDNAARLVASDDIQKIPSDLRDTVQGIQGAVEDVRGVIGGAGVQALPEQLSGIADDIAGFLEDLETREAVGKLTEAIDQATEAAAEIGSAAEGVPALLERIESVAAKAEALDFEGLLAQVSGLATRASDILGTDAAKALPDTLTSALDGVGGAVEEAKTLLADLNEAAAVETLTAALENVNAAAADIGEAASGLPELIEDARAVAAKAAEMELDTLVSEVTELVESADALIGSADAQALPGSLGAAFDEVSAALSELREGGTVESVNSALASAEKAAESVAVAAEELPDLVRRTEEVLREAEQALTSLSDSGSLNREAQATLREVSRAAESVRSLARTLERKPNALLTGK